MLVVSKVSLFCQGRRINNKNNEPSLRRNEMNDSVSFRKREKSFIKALGTLCKNEGDRNLMATVQGLAHDIDPKHPDVIAELERIKNDSSIGKGIQRWILEELPEMMGVGGNTLLGKEDGLTKLLDRIF